MKTRPTWSTIAWNTALVITMLLLGSIFAAQWNVALETGEPTTLSSREDLSNTIRQLETEQALLKERLALLRADLTSLQDESAADSELLDQLAADLEAQRVVAGLRAMRGPGIRLTLADSTVDSLPTGANPNDYIVHDYDLRDVVSLLWASNAEAIAVNEERIVSSTSIYCVGSTIMVNNTRLSPPYEIRAIGDAAKLSQAVSSPASLPDLKARAKVYGLQMRAAEQAEMVVPAFQGSFAMRHVVPAN